MNSKKHILAFALSIATTVAATIPHEEVNAPVSALVEAAQTAETTQAASTSLAAVITLQNEEVTSDLQTIAADEVTPTSGLQTAVELVVTESPASDLQATTTSEEIVSAIEVTIEQAQAMGFDLSIGETFEHDGKKYIITATASAPVTTETVFVESAK